MTDSLADMLSRIRNGQNSKLISVLLPSSKVKCAVLDVLKEEGYINDYKVTYNNKIGLIEVFLKYLKNGKGAIFEIKKVSKPGKRVYCSIKLLPTCYNNMGIHVLSTSQGMMSERKARMIGVGGEVICKVF